MKKIVLSLIILLLLILPQVAVAQNAAIVSVSATDTVAGFETLLKAGPFTPATSVIFQVLQPNKETLSLKTQSNEQGVARYEMTDNMTRKAGVYAVSVLTRRGIVGDTTFTVYADEADYRISKVYTNRSSIPADGMAAAELTVHLQDRFGNAIAGNEITIVSNRPRDVIAARQAFTDEQGNAFFEIRSREKGTAVLTVIDKTTEQTFENRRTINFVSPRQFSLGIGGDDVVISSSFLALDDATPSLNTKSFTISNMPDAVTVNENISLTVTAKKQDGSVDTGYISTVVFSSTDENAVLPNEYAFQPSDRGQHTFELSVTFKNAGSQSVTVQDKNQNAVKGEITIDVQAARSSAVETEPVIITKPESGSYGANTVKIEGTATPNATVTIFDNGRQLDVVRAGTNGAFSYTTGPLADGEHAIYAESEGEISEEVVITINARPAALDNVELNPNPVAPGRDVEIILRSDADIESVSIVMSDIIVQLTKGRDGNFTGKLTAPAAAGSYPLDVLIIDEQGNEASFVEAATLVVDSKLRDVSDFAFHVPSRVTGVIAAPGGNRVTLTWNAATDDTGIAFYRIYYGIDRNNLNLVANTFDANTAWYIPNLQNGVNYFFQVVGVDDESNESDQPSGIVSAVPNGSLRNQNNNLSFNGSRRTGPPSELPDDGPGILGLLIPFAATGLYGAIRRIKNK